MATTFLTIKNRAYSKLAAAITDVITTITVTAGEGARFPSTYPFHITIDDEIMSCTNRSTDTLTVTRAQQNTTGAAHANKSYVALNITAQSMTDLNTAVNTIEATITGGEVVLADDKMVKFGTSSDIAMLLRSTSLNANTALTGVLIGTPVTQAIAADSLMVSNVTASGDIALYVNKGGHSQMIFFADASAGDTALMAASGASVDFFIAGSKVLDYATGAFAFQQNVTISSTGTLTLTTPVLGVATATSINGLVITASTGAITTGSWTATVVSPVYGGTGIANNVASTLTITGAFATTLTVTAATGVTLPTTGTLVSSVTTGNGVSATNTAGALSFTLGVITPTSVNGLTLVAAATGFTIAGGTTSKTLTVPLDASVSGTNTGDNTVATSGDSATSFFASGVLEVGIGGTGVTSSTGTVAVVLSNTPTLVTPILGVASATSLATSAAIPLLMTYGQLVNISLTSQTVGATTLTIPDFASVVDEFTFKTKAQTMANKTLTSPTINGTIGTTGLTLPAITLGGAVSGGSQVFTAVGNMTFAAGSIIASGSTNGNTLLIAANDTTFITLTTGATDVCTITTPVLASLYQVSGGGLISFPASVGADTVCLIGATQELDGKTLDSSVAKGTWTASGTWTIPAVTLGGALTLNGQVFNAGTGTAQINTGSSGSGLIIQSTQDSADGARLKLLTISGSPEVDDVVGYMLYQGRDSGGNSQDYGEIDCGITSPTSGTEDSKFIWYLMNLGTWNKAMTLSGAGDLWIDKNLLMDTGYVRLKEMAAPGALGADLVGIYSVVGGDTLTDLAAVFQDGTIDIFAQEATEPDSPIFQFPDGTEFKSVMRKPDRKTVQFVAQFPDGREFVMREIQYPSPRWN